MCPFGRKHKGLTGSSSLADITYKNVDGIVNEVEKLGIVQIRRIYADWTSEIMRGWRQTVLTNALTPIHQFQSSSGKGNTDSMMIIDAMDILAKNKDIESFCIVSSDADFTRLATKLREEGKLVLGIGSNLTPAPFVVACNRFVYLHNLMKEEPQAQQQQQQMTQGSNQFAQPRPSTPSGGQQQQQAASPMKPGVGKPSVVPTSQSQTPSAAQPSAIKIKAKIDMTQREPKPGAAPIDRASLMNSEAFRTMLPVITRAWAMYRLDNGWAPLEGVSAELARISPGFQASTFGPFMKLEELLEATDVFELKRPHKSTPYWQVRRVVRARTASAAPASSTAVAQ